MNQQIIEMWPKSRKSWSSIEIKWPKEILLNEIFEVRLDFLHISLNVHSCYVMLCAEFLTLPCKLTVTLWPCFGLKLQV